MVTPGEFTQAEMVRILEIGSALRSVPKKARKAEVKQAMARFSEQDHALMVRWITHRLSRGLRG